MNRSLLVIVMLLFGTIVLTACSDGKEDNQKEANKPDDTEETPVDDAIDDTYEHQLDLVVGDTGTFETLIGVFEVTLNEAELLGAEGEYDGQEVQFDDLLKMELTIKNISDETYSIDDFLDTLEVTDNLEGSGFSLYGKEVFDSLDDLSGDLAPGEEKTGECIVEVYDEEAYYLRRVSGNTVAGDTNEVIFTIRGDEAK